MTLRECFIFLMIPYFRVLNLSITFWVLKKLLSELENKRVKEIELLELSKSALKTELLSLTNQINPHFFYNSLNLLYAYSIPYSDKFSKNILALSQMMRHSIQENDINDTIPLEQEIAYMKNYLYLDSLGSDIPNENVIIRGNVSYRKIVPMILQPIVSSSCQFGEKIIFEIIIEQNRIILVNTYIKKEALEFFSICNHYDNIKAKMVNKYYQDISVIYDSETKICQIRVVILS
ncbi:MAG: histidine kinase [Arcicella sp.]|nr:histidine kinase [Arcicella sp.]